MDIMDINGLQSLIEEIEERTERMEDIIGIASGDSMDDSIALEYLTVVEGAVSELKWHLGGMSTKLRHG